MAVPGGCDVSGLPISSVGYVCPAIVSVCGTVWTATCDGLMCRPVPDGGVSCPLGNWSVTGMLCRPDGLDYCMSCEVPVVESVCNDVVE